MFDTAPFNLVSLNEIVTKKENCDPRKRPKWTFRYIDIAAVSNKTFQIKNSKHIVGANAPSRARKVIRQDDVIFATTRPYLKSVARVPAELDGQICSTGFCVLRPTERVMSDWLFYCAISDSLLSQIIPKMRGANYPAVTDKDILAAKIPLPPIAEQSRIVAWINECIDRIKEIEAISSESFEEANILRQAVLNDIKKSFEGKAESRDLKSLIKVASGQFLPAAKMKKDGEFPVYGGNGVTGMHDKFLFRDPVIVIGRVGAKCGCVHITTERAWVTDNALYVQEEYEKFDKRFLAYMLEGANLRQYARQAAQPVISGKAIYSAEIPFVPVTGQSVIADTIEAALSGIDELHTQSAERGKETAYLRESILHKAFSGEL